MKLKLKSTHHINYTVPVAALDKARAFYIDLLGFEEITKPEMFKDRISFWLKSDEIEIHINEDENHHPSERHVAFMVEEVDEIKEYLENNDVKIRYSKPFGNYKRFSFYDPFGNRIELMQNILKKITFET